MGPEARPWGELEDTVSITDNSGCNPSAGSYELHVLSEKARSIASSEANPNDELETNSAHNSVNISHLPTQSMSRTPLLVRSSPAQGTGSYGGLPTFSPSSSPGDSDADNSHVTNPFLQHSKRKGKSKLGQGSLSHSRTSLHRSQDGSISSEPVHGSSRTRRRSNRDASSNNALDETLEGQEESGLEPRFNGSSAIIVPASAPAISETLHSFPTSNDVGEPEEEGAEGEEQGEEQEDSSERDELHDWKSNGHPSDNSPYAQVRASVPATDDISLSINTPRMWILSIFFAILGSATNLFFSLRYPSISITPIIALLLVHPLGLLWDQILKRFDDPEETFTNGYNVHNGILDDTSFAQASQPNSMHSPPVSQFKDSWRRRLRLWLAQGRWNQKEHCCVYISSNVSFGFAFATDVSNPTSNVAPC
jgi:hypothetical protein